MVTRVQKWGNSQGLRFPREILRKAAISVGEEVDISVKKGSIVVKPSISTRGRYQLKELVSRMPSNYKPTEENWGIPEGKEVW